MYICSNMGYDNLHIIESIASIKFWTLTSIYCLLLYNQLTFSFKHGLCFKISIYWNPKPKQTTLQHYGLDVDRGCSTWRGIYNWSWMHIHVTCIGFKISWQWTKSWRFPNGMEDLWTSTPISKWQNAKNSKSP